MQNDTMIPQTLKSQIQNAQNLLAKSEQANAEGNTALAEIRAREGLRVIHELTTRNPELGALLSAGHMGYKGFEITTTERSYEQKLVPREFMGISMGTEVIPINKYVTTTKRYRLF
ncbi:MAG: hypothetical protein ACOYON_05025 [Fimbriimonas sp.]